MVEKGNFLQLVKTPYSKNRFLVILRSIFSTCIIFSGRGRFYLLSTFEEEYFDEKKSSLAGLIKVIQFPAETLILANFDYLGPHSKSIFSTCRQNFKKRLEVCWGRFLGTLCQILSLLSLLACGGE